MNERYVRRVRRAMGVLYGLIALGGCAPPPPPPPAAPVEAPKAPVFTQAQYDKLLFGLTYGQVADLLDSESTRQESTYDQGNSEYVRPVLTAWHYWENEDGSYIKLGFIEKKLAEKQSEKLPH